MKKWNYEGCSMQVFNGIGLAIAKEDHETHGILFRNIGFIFGCFKITFLWTKE